MANERTQEGDPRTRRIHEESQGKLPELAVCPDCGASYREGRWTAQKAPVGAYEHRCPACERVAQGYPAGVVHLAGAFVREHRDELMGLVRNVEERERGQHPLERVMEIHDEDEGVRIETTGVHLAERLGRALHDAYEGELELPPTRRDPQELVRVRWSRD